MNSDSLFDTLPQRIRRLIDEAFDKSIKQNSTTTRPLSEGHLNHPRVTQDSGVGTSGGFFPETTGGGGGGGFILEDTEQGDSDSPGEIPFNLIPSALQLLDLPPDDKEILDVLRNAASGWTSASASQPQEDLDRRYVTREDWRSVCAVLLENRVTEADEDRPVDSSQYFQDEEDEDVSMDDDDYSNDETDSAESDEEYEDSQYHPSHSQKSKAPRPESRYLPVSLKDPQKSTKRQRQTCLEAFGLFFPESSLEDLPKQKIMIADLQRISTLLGEKTKTEELLDMLDMFSTSPDKAMNFEDFTRMMITAKLA